MASFNELLYHIVFRYKSAAKIIIILIITTVTLLLYETGVLRRFELLTIDYRFRLRPHKFESSDIIFIDMAEDSIDAIGCWPWPRKWHATLLAALTEYNPRVVAFDVIFSEPQNDFDDGALEEAIKLSGRTYLPMLYNLVSQDVKDVSRGKGIVSVLKPIERFRRWIKGTGHINALPDPDGILRRIPPIIEFGNDKTYQLGFKIGCDLLGVREEDISFDSKRHVISVKKPSGKIMTVPLDDSNQLMVNWKGRWGATFTHYSYLDVIRSFALIKEGKEPLIDPNVFRGKICLVGLTAAGLIDIKPIPIERAYPAVSANALTLDSLVSDNFVYETRGLTDILLIIAVSIFMVLFLFRLRPLSGMVAALLAIVAYSAFSITIFNLFGVFIATFYPIFAIFVSYIVTTVYIQTLQTVERAMLFRQATRDGLTNLYNIRHFNLLLEAEFKNASVYRFRKLSLILTDLDDFKQINDTYGHLAGDSVLTEVAGIIQSACRKTDVIARYGGEEFIIMLIGTDEKNAYAIAEKIRVGIESKKFRFKDNLYTATISAGVAEFTDEHDKKELVEKADKALYKAKREGKNKVCAYSEEG